MDDRQTPRSNEMTYGQQTKRNSLILLGAVVVVFALIYLFAPEGTDTVAQESAVKPAPTTVVPTEAPIQTAQAGVETALGQFAVTVGASSITQEVAGNTTVDQFVVVDLTFKNNDTRARDLSHSIATLIDGSGVEYKASDFLRDGFLYYETVNPGLTRSYKIAFETPAGISGLKLRLKDGVAFAAETAVEFTLK
ncbi:DUF4352 domain-containing protein [Paenibacillus sp. YIM B09110]|uniref:DUF4352 domain-containing protein n=1 Tax=Paenibacillus sp. YIM B09110 TaxID=3126102 RepID=UPI00301C1DDD